MDFQTIVFLTIAGVLMLVILVLAALVLSAASFTQLAALIRFLGSLLAQQQPVPPPAPTISSTEAESATDLAGRVDTRTMPESPHGNTKEKST
jgi:asparagine N-glycosylation enzyme membrane subunit Stt3